MSYIPRPRKRVYVLSDRKEEGASKTFSSYIHTKPYTQTYNLDSDPHRKRKNFAKENRRPFREKKAQQPLFSPAQRRARLIEIINFFVKTYPMCFSLTNPKPLKIRIHQDIFAKADYLQMTVSSLPISKIMVREALCFYTKSEPYKHALSNAEGRVDLTGEIVSPVQVEMDQV
ncbi:MAG: ProQ/FinO family protein [Alphaproteobacteria bacterium]|jgi:hypothetical protein|nr:ProQ/FinO family protein [Alphaproteobacteria bacterium]MBP9877811.1 ProQ/FinO family protein [Alphaproteobacteria bacterium]